jgi:ribose transport system permease protein
MENKKTARKFASARGMGQVITVTFGLIALCAFFGIKNPNFISIRNLPNLLRQIAPFLIIGIGQSYVLITGNIDLSIGSVVGMSCMISATLMTKSVPPGVAVAITIICCLVIGVINGALVAIFKLPPFIATLGTMTIGRGIAQIVNNNYNTDSIGEAGKAFRDLFYSGKTMAGSFTIYSGVILTVILWLIFNFILSATRAGRHIYAIGSNAEAAKLSGVSVFSATAKAYLVSAFCACVVGLITTATTGMGTMDAGNGYELYAVAASVIGGVSTLGGQGILLGTVVGASIWAVLQNGLSLLNAPVAIKNIVVGVIVVFSVLLDVVIRRGAPKGFNLFKIMPQKTQ